ncbi:Hypothetical_protein [Hexamita inflata]|uniref:Hypothetical_protein n=1 Tax=Hexamita inflata TaxID=28002 RepID=A0AA86TN22_9EUKA|nr:Hypothetical protein HINF_LOCUS5373 [Hexamita inflata]
MIKNLRSSQHLYLRPFVVKCKQHRAPIITTPQILSSLSPTKIIETVSKAYLEPVQTLSSEVDYYCSSESERLEDIFGYSKLKLLTSELSGNIKRVQNILRRVNKLMELNNRLHSSVEVLISKTVNQMKELQ